MIFVIATCFVSRGAAFFMDYGVCVMAIEGDSMPATNGALRLKRIRRAGDQSLVRALSQSRVANVKLRHCELGQSAE